ncbi:MAG: type II secretion system protein GspC [Myxococcales bacterium]
MSLDLHRKKLSVTIVLVTLALCAFFLARGATALLVGAILPPEPLSTAAATGGAPAPRPPGFDPPDIKAILKRNIFDRETGPLWPPKVPEPEVVETDTAPVPPALLPGELPPPCEGSTKLIAAVHSEGRPEWSFASLGEGKGDALLYREGSTLDGKQVVNIYPKAVYLKDDSGKLCSITMFAEAEVEAPERPQRPTPRRSTAARKSSRKDGIDKDDLDSNITKVSDTKFTVQRSLVDKVLENQAEIMRSARVVPHEQNGKVVGVKLYGIRRNSLLGKLGLQNGDLLRTINGYEMSSPDTALEAYSKLRSASDLSIAVTRRGRAMNLEYEIQ